MNQSLLSQGFLFLVTTFVWSSEPEISYRKVVDTQDELPHGDGTWAGFYNPAISDGEVVFLASRASYLPISIFAEFGGEIVHVASDGDSIPLDGRNLGQGSGAKSTLFPIYHNKRIYWETILIDESDLSSGVVEYSDEGLRVAFDEASVDEHAETSLFWVGYQQLSIGPDDQVVRALAGPGNESNSDDYLWLIGFDGDNLSTVNEGTSLPPSTTRFNSQYAIYEEGFTVNSILSVEPNFRRDHLGTLQVLDVGLDEFLSPERFYSSSEIFGNGRWFAAQCLLASDLTGVIVGWAAGEWFEVIREGGSATDGTVITGLSDIGVSRYSLEGDSLLFTSYTADGNSLFLFRDGEVRRLLSPGDFIDEREVSWITIGRECLEGNHFTFVTGFTDSTRAVYVGDLSSLYPAPTNSLKIDLSLTASHEGNIVFPAKEGEFYHLIQSDDLQRSRIVQSRKGEIPMGVFNFDNSQENPQETFYWVEEVTYKD